jgi:hypothetical protein
MVYSLKYNSPFIRFADKLYSLFFLLNIYFSFNLYQNCVKHRKHKNTGQVETKKMLDLSQASTVANVVVNAGLNIAPSSSNQDVTYISSSSSSESLNEDEQEHKNGNEFKLCMIKREFPEINFFLSIEESKINVGPEYQADLTNYNRKKLP